MSQMMFLRCGSSGAGTPAFVGPLDDYEGILSGGVSFSRRLFTSYAGSAFKVRRSSDSTEQDIGFTALGLLDTGALLDFCGAGDGFIVTAYDQKGSNNYTQATATKQPQIVSSGVVVEYNGAPAALGDGTDDVMTASSADWATASFILAHHVVSGAGTARKPFVGSSTNAYAWHYLSSQIFSGGSLTVGSYSNGAGAVFGANLNGASSYLRNQATTGSGDVGAGGAGPSSLFGRTTTDVDAYNGGINELLWLNGSVLSNGNLDTICAALRTTYGL